MSNFYREKKMKYIIGPKMRKNGILAGNKFPRDVIKICKNMGYTPVYINENYSKRKLWKLVADLFRLFHIKNNSQAIYIDQVYVHRSRNMVFSILKNKKINIVSLLEDVEPIRNQKMPIEDKKEALNSLKLTKCIISQNVKMSNYLRKQGIQRPMIELKALDFLSSKIASYHFKRKSKSTICYGGNLSILQSGFLCKLKIKDNDYLQYYVYGYGKMKRRLPNYVFYKGNFSAENCVNNLKGDWGLVWNGKSISIDPTDDHSIYYNYVCPHKFSMYALCGMPVIVYAHSAMAKFVLENKCGILINDLSEISSRIKSVSLEEYQEYRYNILRIAKKMAKGEFTKVAVRKAEKIVEE